jgi:Cro/C1-type HTH DNA-binding domain
MRAIVARLTPGASASWVHPRWRLMRERGIPTGAELACRSGVPASVINRLRRNRTPERRVEQHNLRKIAALCSTSHARIIRLRRVARAG